MSDDLRTALSKMSGAKVDPGNYYGFFMNDLGEPIVFVARRGEKTATFLHGDADWQPVEVSDDSIHNGPMGWSAAGTLLDENEASWLQVCLRASAVFRSLKK